MTFIIKHKKPSLFNTGGSYLGGSLLNELEHFIESPFTKRFFKNLDSETGQKVGFITPLTHNFCESCNRVRMTCTGQLFMCLGQEEDADLRSALREGSDNDHLLRKRIMQAVDRKPKGHDFDYSRKKISGQMSRFMSHTGG